MIQFWNEGGFLQIIKVNTLNSYLINMYPNDNIFNIYYNIGKRTPFLVKRCEVGLARSSSEERRIDTNQDRRIQVEEVKPRGKYGKAYGNVLSMESLMILTDKNVIRKLRMRKFHVQDVANGF